MLKINGGSVSPVLFKGTVLVHIVPPSGFQHMVIEPFTPIHATSHDNSLAFPIHHVDQSVRNQSAANSLTWWQDVIEKLRPFVGCRSVAQRTRYKCVMAL